MDITFDASLAIYVATSNDPGRIPESVRSRLREFQISAPSGEQALQAARVIVKGAMEQLGVKGFVEPEARIAHGLAHMTAREITRAVKEAVARALQDGRMHLVEADLPTEPSDAGASQRQLH